MPKSIFCASILLLTVVAAACSDDEKTPAAAATGNDGGTTNTTPGTDGGGSSTPTDSGSNITPTGPLTTGTGYILAYSATTIGIQTKSPISATFTDGKFVGYDAGESEKLDIASATQAAGGGGEGGAVWGAWEGGPTSGKFFGNPNGTFVFQAPAQGFHYAVGKPGDAPAAAFTYALLGGSAPTVEGGAAAGQLTKANVACDAPSAVTSCTVDITVKFGTVEVVQAAVAGNLLNVPNQPKQVRVNKGSFGVMALFATGDLLLLSYEMDNESARRVRGSAVLKKQ